MYSLFFFAVSTFYRLFSFLFFCTSALFMNSLLLFYLGLFLGVDGLEEDKHIGHEEDGQ